MHNAPREPDRLLTGACLALAGVALGAGIAWALLRSGPTPERAPVVIVSPAPTPVVAAVPSERLVYPSSAFTPNSEPSLPREAAFAPVNAPASRTIPVQANDQRQFDAHPNEDRVSSRGPEVFIYPGASSALPLPVPSWPSSNGQINHLDDAISFALEGIDHYLKQGYTLREDTWGGDLSVGEGRSIAVLLFKGNDYWFSMGSDVKGGTISVHVYDGEGTLAEETAWQKTAAKGEGAFAAARVAPKRTGTYFLIVKVVKSDEEHTGWGLVYAYR